MPAKEYRDAPILYNDRRKYHADDLPDIVGPLDSIGLSEYLLLVK